jgi:hypothetical protein
MEKKKEKEEVKVKGSEPVKIEYLKGSKFHKQGDISTVHRVQAEKLQAKKIVKIVSGNP